jgi:hypothetical protein
MGHIMYYSLAIVLSAASPCPSSRDEESARKVVRLFQQDFNDGGFQNAPDYTTHDWEHIHSGGGIVRSREEVLREVRGVHQTFP